MGGETISAWSLARQMTRSDVSGSLLIASFVLWLPAAALPSRVWTAPLRERLGLIAQQRRRWQTVNISIGGAAVLLVLGFAALAEPLERMGGGVLVPVSLAALVLGAALWLASIAFRVTAMAAASSEEPVVGLEAVSAWAGGLFLAWTALGNAAVVGFGAAVADSGYPAAWSGWAAIVLASLMLVQLLITGDALPALYHIGPSLIGIALILD
jgi:hypothetical protein